MNHASLKTLGIALIAAMPLLASAQLSGNLGLTSNYKYRGQDQDTSKTRAVKPALQGGFDYAFGESGWYVGNWNSSVNWLSGNSIEMDLYGGYNSRPVRWTGIWAPSPTSTRQHLGQHHRAVRCHHLGPTDGQVLAHGVERLRFRLGGRQGGLRPQGHQHGLPGVLGGAGSGALGHAQGLGRVHALCQRHQLHGRAQLHRLQRGRRLRPGRRLSLGAAVAGGSKKAYFGPVNKSRLLVTLTKTL